MNGFDYTNNNYSSDDDDYDPYDDMKNGRIKKCKNGYYYGVANYCCHKCFLEQKKNREDMRNNFLKYILGDDYVIIEEDEVVQKINKDWKILKLIPPKSLAEIKNNIKN